MTLKETIIRIPYKNNEVEATLKQLEEVEHDVVTALSKNDLGIYEDLSIGGGFVFLSIYSKNPKNVAKMLSPLLKKYPISKEALIIP